MKTFISSCAQNHFGVLIDAARIPPSAVTKYDKRFVVVMAVEEYERLWRWWRWCRFERLPNRGARNEIRSHYLPRSRVFRHMKTTNYHAKYFAYELNKRNSADNIEKLAVAVAGAQVDLNPHQVDAALFAFSFPLSKGVLLADEVDLSKTIEAGLLLSQHWAERKRSILIIVPSNLRKQWSQDKI